MTRILQIMAGAAFGGAETYFVDLVTALHRSGLDQRVVIRRNPQRAATLRAAGIDPIELTFGGMFDFATRPALARVIAAYRPNIVQSWMNRATRFVTRPQGARFVYVGWFGGYYKLANYRHCDHLVGVTEAIRRHQIAQGWPEDRAHYLPTFAHRDRAPAISRAPLETPADAPLFLALGRLHRKKAFDILLEALARVPGAYLWLAGEGELRAQLERQTDALGLRSRVRFLGWRDDRAALFAAADFCVMPSRYEPFGTVMLEAWAHGRPLIAAEAAGPSGLIRNEGDGLLVPVDDAQALAAAMARLVNDRNLAGQLARAGTARFELEFTEETVVARYQAFYRRIAR